MQFDFMPYGTKTKPEVLKIVRNGFKGYKLLNIKNPNGNYEANFFIFQKISRLGKPKQEFLRICLKSKGWHEKRVFYWSVDFNFKPFRKCNKWRSEEFKGTAEDLYLSRFLEAIGKIKNYIQSEKRT